MLNQVVKLFGCKGSWRSEVFNHEFIAAVVIGGVCATVMIGAWGRSPAPPGAGLEPPWAPVKFGTNIAAAAASPRWRRNVISAVLVGINQTCATVQPPDAHSATSPDELTGGGK
jgi:hypothetical protein